MYFYKIYGMHVASDLPFPQLVVSEDTTRYDVLIENSILDKTGELAYAPGKHLGASGGS